jgi:hypothetical protein
MKFSAIALVAILSTLASGVIAVPVAAPADGLVV